MCVKGNRRIKELEVELAATKAALSQAEARIDHLLYHLEGGGSPTSGSPAWGVVAGPGCFRIVETFNEEALRDDIVAIWGPAGAHVDVFDEMLRRSRS